MKIRKVWAVYFSPAGHTRQAAEEFAGRLAEALDAGMGTVDFTLPRGRDQSVRFASDELVVFGTPTYAGRVPNKILPFVQDLFTGEDTPAVALVTFGNRSADSALIELATELGQNGFRVLAGAALAGPHVFSERLGAGRPDAEDLEQQEAFLDRVAEKLKAAADAVALQPVVIEDGIVRPYYTPLREDGTPAKFLKAKPLTDPDRCDGCGICAQVCPMGSVDAADPANVPGICIKCQACLLRCPAGARYFEDPDFLSHVAMLEKTYARRAASQYVL